MREDVRACEDVCEVVHDCEDVREVVRATIGALARMYVKLHA